MNITSTLESIVGLPKNDAESFLIFAISCIIATILFFSVVYVFKVIANMFNRNS